MTRSRFLALSVHASLWLPAGGEVRYWAADQNTDKVILNAHGLTDGTVIRITGKLPGQLPGGQLANTNYWVINPTPNDLKR